MATLKSNGNLLVEMKVSKFTSDGAEGDPMTKREVLTYRAMSGGWMLRKIDVWLDYGLGSGEEKIRGVWRRHSKIKKELLSDKRELFNRMQTWADNLRLKGFDAEIS